MLPIANRIILIAMLIGSPNSMSAQEKIPHAAWLLPGASWHPSKNVRLLGQLGYNHYFRMRIVYPQAFITVHKHVVVNPAYIFAIQKGEDAATVEHFLMNSIIFQVSRKNFLIDDRNMLWNRFTVGETARHYYRNRLRVMQSFKAWTLTTRLYGYDEVFVLFNYKKLARNRAAIGISCDITSSVNADVTYIRQWDRYSGPINLFFLAAIWQFKNSF